MTNRDVVISVVVPLLNEEGSLRQLFDEIRTQMSLLGEERFEVLFIDDGSRDGSAEVLRELHRKWPQWVRVIFFRRNFGKSTALSVGFERARGEFIFSMDADLQDDPAEIPRFLEKLNEGYDMVSGWKKRRLDPPIKLLLSRIFNAVMRGVSGIHLHDFNCGFKLYRADVLRSLDVYGEMHRFLPIYAHASGFTVTEVVVNHRAREHGESKYGWERLYRGLFDAISVLLLSKYLKKPMHFFGSVGLMFGSAGFLILLYFTILKMMGQIIGFRPLFFAGILFMITGVQVLTFGLLSELFVRFNHKQTDPYSIREELGTGTEAATRLPPPASYIAPSPTTPSAATETPAKNGNKPTKKNGSRPKKKKGKKKKGNKRK